MGVFKKLPKAMEKIPDAIDKAPTLLGQKSVKKVRGKVGTDFAETREGFL